MRRTELNRFRKLLVEKRNELLDRVRAARSSETGGHGDEAPDLVDRALQTVSRDLLYQLSTGERDILRRVDAALERIDKGDYGRCVHCGDNVEFNGTAGRYCAQLAGERGAELRRSRPGSIDDYFFRQR